MSVTSARAGQGLSTDALDFAAVRDFLYFEARLLDTRRFYDWNALFTEDGMYWVPLAEGQPDPVNHLSLVYENAMMREVRIRRLEHERAWSQRPRSRTAHLVSSIVIEERYPDEGRVVVGSAFQMNEWRSYGQRTLAGLYTHELVATGEGLRMASKRVDLINSEGVFEPLEVFI